MNNVNNETDRFRHKPARQENFKPFKPGKDAQTLKELGDGDYFSGDVKILRSAKPGPTVLLVTDGTSAVDAVISETEFKTDDSIHIEGKASSRNGRMQIEVKRISKSELNLDEMFAKAATPVRQDFSIHSERYNKMKHLFIKIATRFRMAVITGQPIFVRHHNDSDGINAGLVLEIALEAMMKRFGVQPDYNLYRMPSKAPFYDVGDSLRDIIFAKKITGGFGQKKPLLVIVDNGSTPEDIFGLKAWYSLGYEAMVIDHHNPVEMMDGMTAVCKYLSNHLNPHMHGFDGETSAGMLCYEVARMIDENFSRPEMPAVAAISDRSKIDEAEQYIKNSGKSKEELTQIGIAIDFMAYHMKFDSATDLVEEIYSNKILVEMINEEVKQGVETQLQSTLPYLRTLEINGVIFSYIDLEKYTMRFTYPTPGKVLSLISDTVAKGKEMPCLTIGYLSDMIIIRATKPVLPVQKIIDQLQKEMPEANVDGGGHEQAGTIKFVPAHLDAILQKIKEQIKQLA